MKVLQIVGAYGRRHEKILEETLRLYAGFKGYEIETAIMTTEDLKIDAKYEERRFDPSLRHMFLWKWQQVVREFEMRDFDMLLFAEDDMRLTEDNLDYYVEHSRLLDRIPFMAGFLRYEEWDGNRYLVDISKYSWVMGEPVTVNGVRYWAAHSRKRLVPNTHQGVFLLTRD